MDFSEYQKKAWSRAIYPHRGDNLAYTALGLCGESGEVAEKVKKLIRDKGSASQWSDEDRRLLLKELGDVLWYVAAAAAELRADLQEVVDMNLEKIDGRHERGTLGGSGDDR